MNYGLQPRKNELTKLRKKALFILLELGILMVKGRPVSFPIFKHYIYGRRVILSKDRILIKSKWGFLLKMGYSFGFVKEIIVIVYKKLDSLVGELCTDEAFIAMRNVTKNQYCIGDIEF